VEILVDVDGVLADYVGNLCTRFLPDRNPREFLSYDLDDHLTTAEREVWAAERVKEGFCAGIAWYVGAQAFLHDLRDLHKVVILTARDSRAHHWVRERDEWLARAGVRWGDILYCPRDQKHRVQADVLIEDNVDTCNDWARRNRDGHAILVDRPSNQGPVGERVVRASSYREVLVWVDGLAAGESVPSSRMRGV
jgi:5'(3')-deoxyribonucleotidase